MLIDDTGWVTSIVRLPLVVMVAYPTAKTVTVSRPAVSGRKDTPRVLGPPVGV